MVEHITKYLDPIGRFECGLDDLVRGKSYAFTAVMTEDDHRPYGLGVAVKDEPGYYPIPLHWAHSTDYNVMCNHADILNNEMGLKPREAMKIIMSSMARNSGFVEEGRRG